MAVISPFRKQAGAVYYACAVFLERGFGKPGSKYAQLNGHYDLFFAGNTDSNDEIGRYFSVRADAHVPCSVVCC